MIIDNVSVVVNIVGMNKKNYSKVLGQELKSGDTIKIDQKQLLPTSRTLVWCECDICGDAFTRRMNDVLQKKRTIESPTMCGNECKKEYMRRNNPNPKKDKIEVSCIMCNNKKFVNEALYKSQDVFCCSRKCYADHRSVNYSGANMYNHNSLEIECDWCNEKGKTSQWRIEQEKGKYCSLRCYHYHCMKKHGKIIHTKLNYVNNGRNKKTIPEEMVECFLEKNNIKFEEEKTINNIYRADFYLPEYDAYIEVMGDFWHVNPDVYGNDESGFTDFQLLRVRADRLKLKYLKDFGFNVILAWEKDIIEDVDKCLGNIISTIKNKQESSTTNTPNSFNLKDEDRV